MVCALLAGVLGGCLPRTGSYGEPVAATDAVPPPGYSPIYLTRIAPVPATPASITDPAVQISRIEAYEPNKVRALVQFVDSAGTYYTGAVNGKWRSYWCGVEDEFEGKVRPVKNYTLREVTENDREAHAVALVMDNSGSMGDARALAAQEGATDFIRMKKDEDAVGLIRYDHHVEVESPLTTGRSDLLARLKVNGLTGFGGGTAIANGIAAGIDQLLPALGFRRKAIIVFTDGQDNSSTIDKEEVINRARKAGIIVCAVDFGEGVSSGYLEEIAVRTGGIYYQIYRTSEFGQIFEDVYRRLRNYYVLEYNPLDYGVHKIYLKLCLGTDTVSTVAAYDNTPDIGAIALLNVQFDVNKSDIKPASMASVDNVFGLMKAYPGIRIELRGHTDSTNSTGDPDYNVKLSQRRADAVKDNLVKRGIAGDRIKAIGFGERQPIADNKTEEGRAANRRTEFVIVAR